MKTSAVVLGFAATRALAHPGMDRVMAEIETRDDFVLGARSSLLFGDLLKGAVTNIGNTIKSILQQGSSSTNNANIAYSPPGPLGSNACNNDPLCVWYYVAKEMYGDFADILGCTDLARGAVRLGFHDAAGWDVNSAFGGADGSLLLTDELSLPENRGLASIGAVTKGYYNKYNPYGAGMADIIQLGAIVGTVACPGGPRIRAFAGRIDDPRPNPRLLPSPFMSAPVLIDLFANKTFTANDLVALVGAHTSAKQSFVDVNRPNAPLDLDPQIWDASFYAQTLIGNNKTFFILPSDKALATFSSTRAQWNAFAGLAGQALWNPAFADAYFRMSMLGVNNMNQLIEITRVVPSQR
ncbi:class II peroxidase [Xylariaceae sp. FL1651]|nr:class II peroxidase [Xylariaceae sp. FL1651]